MDVIRDVHVRTHNYGIDHCLSNQDLLAIIMCMPTSGMYISHSYGYATFKQNNNFVGFIAKTLPNITTHNPFVGGVDSVFV